MLIIRRESDRDIAAIRQVVERAFGRPSEADLIEMLRQAGKATVSLVAVLDGHPAGHVLFSPVELAPAHVAFKGAGLGPVSVLPEFQGQGIGSGLIRQGLDTCREAGVTVVVVLGDPGYYSRFGFARAGDHGLGNEYGVGEHFMALELQEGAMAQAAGMVRYQPEFAQASC